MDSGLAPTVRPGMTSFGILAMRCIRVLLTKETRKRSLGDHLPRPHLNGGLPAKNKEAERRQTHGVDARAQAACGTRHGEWRLAPPSAYGRARLPAFHLRFSPAGLSSRRFSVGPGFPKSARKLRTCRTRRQRSQRCTSRAGLIAGRHDARAARVRTVSFRPRAPRSLRPQEVPFLAASFKSETAAVMAIAAAKSKAREFVPMYQSVSRHAFFEKTPALG
jgi:hypothetical protein